MSLKYYLRNLSPEEWEKFHELELLLFPEDLHSRQSFESAIKRPKSLFVVAVTEENNQFIGYFRIATYGLEGHIQRIGIHPDYQRRGLGSELMERCLEKLTKAGCKKIFLYVTQENVAAINLYKKYHFEVEKKSWQFEFPFAILPEQPKGKCRDVEWGEISLLSLRFNLNPERINLYFGLENQYVLIFEVEGRIIGICRFDPNFPGAMPFIITDIDYALDFVAHLRTQIVNPDFDKLLVTFDGQEELAELFIKNKIKMTRELYYMSRKYD